MTSSQLPLWIKVVLVCGGCTLMLLLVYNENMSSLMQGTVWRLSPVNVTLPLVIESLRTAQNNTTIQFTPTVGSSVTSKTGSVTVPTIHTQQSGAHVTHHTKGFNMSQLTKPGNTTNNVGTPRLRNGNPANISVVIGMGITSKGMLAKHPRSFLQHLPLFTTFLGTFCETASIGYSYHYYFAYDMDDKYYTNEPNVQLFKGKFADVTNELCKHLGTVELHLVKCNHSGRPAWAQNDAMMAAYNDGHDFFYRVNDDSVLITKNWTSIFISELRKMRPPLLGVVGPNHSGGNEAILTYDFVHRTHVDIFGYYYPREFPWWFADDWVTKVYLPDRSKKLMQVRLRHTMTAGSRYHRQHQDWKFVGNVIRIGQERVQKYVATLSQ